MNRSLFSLAIWLSALLDWASLRASPPSSPHFVLNLNLNEFSILNVSEMDGISKYGGSGDLRLSIAKEGSSVVWNVTVENPRVMELMGVFVGEKALRLIQSLNPNNLDPNQKIALEAVKSLSLKIESAQANPVWDLVTRSGLIVPEGTNLVLKGRTEKLLLTGNSLTSLRSRSGAPVVADGYIKTQGQFEVTRFLDQKTNTLEVFVMGFCPFGQRAEASLLSFLDKNLAPGIPKPKIEVHFIFYRTKNGEVETFTSLHGDDEVIEDLVQIVLRDSYPSYFQTYLLLRANNRTPWKTIAANAGLKPDDLAAIEERITRDRSRLVQSEYAYATRNYDILDGSPSFVWEGEKVSDLRTVDVFRSYGEPPQDACAK